MLHWNNENAYKCFRELSALQYSVNLWLKEQFHFYWATCLHIRPYSPNHQLVECCRVPLYQLLHNVKQSVAAFYISHGEKNISQWELEKKPGVILTVFIQLSDKCSYMQKGSCRGNHHSRLFQTTNWVGLTAEKPLQPSCFLNTETVKRLFNNTLITEKETKRLKICILTRTDFSKRL